MKADTVLHPSRDLLHACSLGKLGDAASAEVLAHLQTCPQCCNEAANVASDSFLDLLRTTSGADVLGPDPQMIETGPLEASSTSTAPYAGPSSPQLADAFQGMLAPPRSVDELGWLSNYRILEVLGRGGMGVVFRAEDPKLARHVAIKVMRPESAAEPEAHNRFLREARATAAIQHDHIIPIFHVGEERGVPFIVMPLLNGQTLEDRLKEKPSLTLAETIRIGREIALGLAAAHQHGLVHRDIKPSNIWLEARSDGRAAGARDEGREARNEKDPTDAFATQAAPLTPRPSLPAPRLSLLPSRVKILDFGLARVEEMRTEPTEPLTKQGAVMGTPAYMSPEQGLGKTVDFRSDLYSLGIVLYRLAAGQLPFVCPTATGYIVAHSRDIPKDVRTLNPAIPAGLGDLIMQMLAKDPHLRPVSAQAVATTLGNLLLPETQPLPAPQPPTRRPRFRRPLLIAGAFGAALLAGVAIVWPGREPSPIVPLPEKKETSLSNQPVRVKALRVKHYVPVGMEKFEEQGVLGETSSETKFKDMLEITADLSAPAFGYLLAFNTNGNEQLLWPLGENRKPSEDAVPPLRAEMKYPGLQGNVFTLDDKEAGGLQAFAAVISSEPLPCFREWKKLRGPAAWKELPAGSGVWSCDGESLLKDGEALRGSESSLPGLPPLMDLCESLQRGRPRLIVEALAFPVRGNK